MKTRSPLPKEHPNSERGAIMVIAVFMAVLLLSILWYVVGIGDVLIYRERMQDAADSTAFAAAVTYARGMNWIVLINIVMALVVAIIVAMRLVELILTIASVVFAIICAIASVFGGGACWSQVYQLADKTREWHDQTEDFIDTAKDILEALHDAQNVLAGGQDDDVSLISIAAEGRAFVMGTGGGPYSPTTSVTFAWPIASRLPVVDLPFSELCGRGGYLVGWLITRPFASLGLPDAVSEVVGDLIGQLAQTAPAYFCGIDGASVPSITTDIQVMLPYDPDGHAYACYDAATDEPNTQDCLAHSEWVQEGVPYESGGTLEGALLTRASRARVGCHSSSSLLQGDITDYRYQIHRYDIVQRWNRRADGSYEMTPESFRFHVPTIGEPIGVPLEAQAGLGSETSVGHEVRTTEHLPCGADGWTHANWGYVVEREPRLWNGMCFRLADNSGRSFVRDANCPGSTRPTSQMDCGGQGRSFIEYTTTVEVVQAVLLCTEEREISREVDTGTGAEFETEDCDYCAKTIDPCVELGDEHFQIRGFAIANTNRINSRREHSEAIVNIASWGRSASSVESTVEDVAEVLGYVAVSQAEYYFHVQRPLPSGTIDWGTDAAERSEWMWHMFWSARFRRFRLSSLDDSGGTTTTTTTGTDDCDDDDSGGSIGDMCSSGSDNSMCGSLGGVADTLESLVLH